MKITNNSQTYTLNITDMGINGEGVAKINNDIFFVNNAIIGETVLAQSYKSKNNMHFCNSIKTITKSVHERENANPILLLSGGTEYHKLNYNTQLSLKQKNLQTTLSKQVKQDLNIQTIVPSDKELHYRNKAAFAIGTINNQIVVGVYKKQSHTLVPVTSYALCDSWCDEAIIAFTSYANKNNLTFLQYKNWQRLTASPCCEKLQQSNFSCGCNKRQQLTKPQ